MIVYLTSKFKIINVQNSKQTEAFDGRTYRLNYNDGRLIQTEAAALCGIRKIWHASFKVKASIPVAEKYCS